MVRPPRRYQVERLTPSASHGLGCFLGRGRRCSATSPSAGGLRRRAKCSSVRWITLSVYFVLIGFLILIVGFGWKARHALRRCRSDSHPVILRAVAERGGADAEATRPILLGWH